LDFRILGPLDVREGEREVPLGRGKQRALLALLLLHRDQVISTDRIVDELWGERPPPTAAKIVQNHVLQLRRALADGGSAGAALVTRGRGYMLHVEPGKLDLDTFLQLVEAGERALASGEAAEAAETLSEALALWRGPPLADFAYEQFAQTAIGRLEELRLAALERRIEADLALGRHREVVGELKELLSAHPLREGFGAQLMLALYRSGRQAEALEVYRDARRALVEELGIDPSPALQELEQAILRQELPPPPERQAPAVARAARAAAAVADAPSGEGREGRATPLRTFLIADIRGYTRFSQDHGDEAASRLARRFADIVREAVPPEVGELLELRGDEALFVFSSAREALQTAVELQRRFRERVNGEPALPLGVGVGLDAGEAVPIEGGYRGRALNVASRLSALARPGEILASETVVSLAGRQEGTSYARRRPARLKGLAEPVRHVAVVPEVELPPLPPPPRPKDRARRTQLLALVRGWTLVAVGGALVVAAVAFAVVRLTGGDGGTPRVEASGVAAIDAGGRAVTGFTSAGRTPSNIAVGEGAVWVLDADDRTISKIDPESGDVKTFSPGTTPTDLAVGAGALWVSNRRSVATELFEYTASISKIDPASTLVTRTLVLPHPGRGQVPVGAVPGVSQLAFGAGSLWAINPDATISRFDAETGKRETTVPGSATSGIAFGTGGVWVVGDGPYVVRIDPKTNRAGEPIPVNASSLAGIAAGAGSVWASAPDEGVVWRIEPDGLAKTIPVGRGVVALAFGEGALWAANYADGTIARIDPATNEVTRPVIRMPGNVQGIAAGAGSAWVSVVGGTSTGPLSTAACGQPESGGKSPDLLIASDLALQGQNGLQTRPMADAIRFVLRRHGFRAGSYAVGYQSCDDSTAQLSAWSDVKCTSNARAYAAAKQVVGVIGTFNSGCAALEIPILNRAPESPLALISASNTAANLTRRSRSNLRPDEPESLYPTGVRNYFRVITDDDVQGAAGAIQARRLGLKRVYVLGMDAPYPLALQGGFETAARKLGIRLLGSRMWESANYTALAERVARARPDGVYLSGLAYVGGTEVVKALRERLGAGVVLLANDSFLFATGHELLHLTGSGAEGMYVTNTAIPIDGLGTEGRRLVREFAATQPQGAKLDFVPEAMQAAEVFLQAIARSEGTRGSVLEQLRRIHVENGVLGSFRFDARGDMSPRLITVNRVERGRIVFNRVISVPATVVP
jgi:DNA-binding SARP family transcriptional activator/ABC-type branched-subunit amino acid transport system substrate-binding protein/DNA-binding beta-propeller fold protein YncE